MNTTVLTSKSTSSHTVLYSGSSRPSPFMGISIVLLGRGGKPFRKKAIQKLHALYPGEVITVEQNAYNLENLARSFNMLKCIITHGEMTAGEKINIAISEASGSHVLVLWDNMELQIPGDAERVFQQAASQNSLCGIPVLLTLDKKPIPTRLAPVFTGKKLEVLPLGNIKNHVPSLYPFDYCGIYHREKFMASRGYDPEISSPYWQKMDFGFRSFLTGEQIQCHTAIPVVYLSDIPKEDTDVDESYARFFLKNLAFHYHNGFSRLSLLDILKYHMASGMSIFNTFEHYSHCYTWFKKNHYCFTMDANTLMKSWGME